MGKKNILSFFEGKSFNVDEAKKISIALERQGYRFYNSMKDIVRQEKILPVFEQMALEEKKHISDIEALLSDPHSEWYLDPAMEAIVQQYFEDYMEGGIFPTGPDAEKATLELKDEIHAVKLALNFEKDAVAFYTEMAGMANDPETSKSFKELVEFEKGHVNTLVSLLKLLEP
jgi:rubrerythrin